MPATDHIGVSRRIEQEDERKRLATLLKEMCPTGYGLLHGPHPKGKATRSLKTDLNFLVRIWESIQEKSKDAHAPRVLHQELGIIFRVIRDLHSHNLKKIIVDDEFVYKKVAEFVKEYLPEEGL